MAHRILMVMTSHDRLGDTGEPTGVWLEEFAAPWFAFRDAGAEVVTASPRGGAVPVDPKSEDKEQQTEATRRLAGDEPGRRALTSARPLAEIEPADFDALFYPGGHGPVWDLARDPRSVALIEAAWGACKPLALVCHGPIALMGARDASGRPIVEGRRVTGFSDAEEEAMGLLDIVPHRVEDVLRRLGGLFECAEPMAPFVRVDGQLVTGQNPASSAEAAQRLLRALEAVEERVPAS